MSCLRAIAGGATRLNEIAQRIGRSRSEEARPFLETLEEMGLVERRFRDPDRGRRRTTRSPTPFCASGFASSPPAKAACRPVTTPIATSRSGPAQLDKFVSEDAFERVCQGWLLRQLDPAAEPVAGGGRSGAARRGSCAAGP